MDNYIAPGLCQTFTAPLGGVVSGQGYLIGSLFVVATHDADAGDPFSGLVTGVVDHAKVPDEVWTEGLKIYFDESEGVVTSDDDTGSNPLIGVTFAPAAADVLIESDNVVELTVDGLEITIVDYTGLAGATVSVTVGGVKTDLLEEDSGAWEAETGNNETATSLAAAIDALDGVAAAAVGAVITVTPGTGATAANPGMGRVRLDGAAR